MNNFYAIEIQSNSDGTSGIIPFGYESRGDAEGKYLALREYARQSSVQVHTVMLIDNKGNVIECMSYTHPGSNTPPEVEE